MERILTGLLPEKVFYYFEEISAIPRSPGKCAKISDYIVGFAKEHGLLCEQDGMGNVLVRKPSSRADGSGDTVILQGHMDMVCEKSYDYEAKHDFTKDSLKLSVLDDYVFAKGTTLGADDGIAIAFMLTILDDDSLVLPPIEALFTVDEEDGMRGAIGYDTSGLKGKYLINLDHEVEGEILTCCAGGKRVKCSLPVSYEDVSGIGYSIVICGLAGGHSGMEIDKGRGNANLLLGRILHTITKNMSYHVRYIGGGLTDSAIPREAKAEIIIDPKDEDLLESIIEKYSHIICDEFEGIEENMMIYAEKTGEDSARCLDKESKRRIGFLLNTVPDGIIKMSRQNEGLVRTSLNSGIMKLAGDSFELIINMRSLAESEKDALADKIQYLIETIGGTYTEEYDYPAWEYKSDSALRDIAFETYQRVFSKNPKLRGFHAGLECGVFFKKIENVDIISIGPEINNIHTPKERLSVSSTQRVYKYLLEILKSI
ncbi:MAG: aminoacyl-histidine dipeptidase [Lachnospiraceae bacterium]|nr:aminoacyl-histidine dipeptidase [Lachnospiraceae bacterium]